ncbi:hypothetical protein N3K63_00540 [Microbacterium sp. W1N]|uniref:glycosyltransferase family 2 protein n=1 Tax=Microbacterium festucae TaxID=2977531 RepID=UPI0021BF6A5F|nr:hypothetical protein [Microbacterium festucae]MCT9818763.1 hypothetical protein [Microbacterium festucae]
MIEPMLFVVSTLGRISALEDLLASITPQLRSDDRLVIVAQRRVDEVHRIVAQWEPRSAGEIRVVSSELGASLGRNTGARRGTDGRTDPLTMFPNDTTTFPPGSVDAIRSAFRGRAAGAVHVMTPAGPRFELPPAGTPLSTRTVWSVIEMGLVIRLSLFRELGGFDENIGTGAPTPWQAGEVTDLLMRLVTRRPSEGAAFVWTHIVGAHVCGIDETEGLSRAESKRKLRAYGRGVGHVYRIHPFPRWQRWGFVLAGWAIGLRRSSDYRLADGGTAFLGRLEGVCGRTWGRDASSRAVSR